MCRLFYMRYSLDWSSDTDLTVKNIIYKFVIYVNLFFVHLQSWLEVLDYKLDAFCIKCFCRIFSGPYPKKYKLLKMWQGVHYTCPNKLWTGSLFVFIPSSFENDPDKLSCGNNERKAVPKSVWELKTTTLLIWEIKLAFRRYWLHPLQLVTHYYAACLDSTCPTNPKHNPLAASWQTG